MLETASQKKGLKLAEFDAAFLHSREVPARMALFLPQRIREADPEFVGGIGESQEGESHQFGGEELVIGKEMKQCPAILLGHQFGGGRELGTRGGA